MKENQTYDRKSLRAVTGKTADFDEIAKDCVAFANREGGHLAIGIEDEQQPHTYQVADEANPSKVRHLSNGDEAKRDEEEKEEHIGPIPSSLD